MYYFLVQNEKERKRTKITEKNHLENKVPLFITDYSSL
jgi:hypothetical protein